MESSPVTLLFFTLLAMAVIWLILVELLFRILAARHPSKYDEMGEPSLNNNMRSNFRLLKFLFTREPKALRDSVLSLQVNIMRVWFVAYVVGFFVLSCAAMHSANP